MAINKEEERKEIIIWTLYCTLFCCAILNLYFIVVVSQLRNGKKESQKTRSRNQFCIIKRKKRLKSWSATKTTTTGLLPFFIECRVKKKRRTAAWNCVCRVIKWKKSGPCSFILCIFFPPVQSSPAFPEAGINVPSHQRRYNLVFFRMKQQGGAVQVLPASTEDQLNSDRRFLPSVRPQNLTNCATHNGIVRKRGKKEAFYYFISKIVKSVFTATN